MLLIIKHKKNKKEYDEEDDNTDNKYDKDQALHGRIHKHDERRRNCSDKRAEKRNDVRDSNYNTD